MMLTYLLIMNIKSALIISVAILIIGFTYLYSERYEYKVIQVDGFYSAYTDVIIRISKYPFYDNGYNKKCLFQSGEKDNEEDHAFNLNILRCVIFDN